MRNTVLEATALQEKKAEITGMCYHEANEGKVFVIVEGADDEKIYRCFLDERKVTFYIAKNCLYVVELLKELTYIIHSGFISGYQNRYGDNLKPPTNVYHRMTA